MLLDKDLSELTLKSVLKEPLLHFLLLAALLFAVDYIWSSMQKEKIVVDRQTVDFLIKQREDLELRKLSLEERRDTIESFVEDEILYSEAYRRGLDRGDSRMRRNLILKMRGLLVGEVKQPTEEELRQFFDENRERFSRPATQSLEHVFFSDSRNVPENLLERLRAGLDPSSVGQSGRNLSRSLPQLSQREIAASFGAEAARAVLAIEDDQWHGPFESPRGVHFVRVVGREPAREAHYEDVRSYLEGDWMMFKSRQAIEQEVERLRDNYDVVIEGLETATP